MIGIMRPTEGDLMQRTSKGIDSEPKASTCKVKKFFITSLEVEAYPEVGMCVFDWHNEIKQRPDHAENHNRS